MKVIYKSSFLRDIKKSQKPLLSDLEIILLNLEAANTLADISNLRKLKGNSSAYRIRLGNYRLCFYHKDEAIIISRFLPRKDVYKVFP